MKTPREMSPLLLVQEYLRDYPWRIIVACMMLNRTSSRQVWPILPRFFERWPDASEFIGANVDDVAKVVRPLGLQNRRAKLLLCMSSEFLRAWPDVDVSGLPGVGKYVSDSYRMFVGGEVIDDAEDKELVKYVEWSKKREQDRDQSS